jgi:hypothetical protein
MKKNIILSILFSAFFVGNIEIGKKVFADSIDDKQETEITITTNISDTTIGIGDKIKIKYNLKYNDNLKLIKQDFSEYFNRFEILNENINDSKTQIELTLITFEVGRFQIPPMTFTFENFENRIFTKIIDGFKIEIKDVELGNNQNLREISNEKLQETSINYFTIIVFVAIIFIIAAIIFNLRRKK